MQTKCSRFEVLCIYKYICASSNWATFGKCIPYIILIQAEVLVVAAFLDRIHKVCQSIKHHLLHLTAYAYYEMNGTLTWSFVNYRYFIIRYKNSANMCYIYKCLKNKNYFGSLRLWGQDVLILNCRFYFMQNRS